METPDESAVNSASPVLDEQRIAESTSDAFERGVARGQLLVILRVLRHYLGHKPIGAELAQQIGKLSFSDMQELSFKMLEFESVSTLRWWLKVPDRDREPDNWVDRLIAEALLKGRQEFLVGVLRKKLGQDVLDLEIVNSVEKLSLSKVNRLIEEFINLDDEADILEWFNTEVR